MEQLNKHAGSSFDDFLKEEVIELLEKKCPRCGGASANSSNSSGRCSACLKKLASNKKKVGHYLHEHKVADDALRRQKGKNGTAKKKHKGLGSRKAIIKKVHTGEKKAGQVLSPDRKDNSKGYSSSNTRMVPKELNRGRHHVDGKKLRAWQKRLKKSDTSDDEFYTMTLAKAEQSNNIELMTLLRDMHANDLANFINNEDYGAELPQEEQQQQPLKKGELLAKDSAAPKLPAHLQEPHNVPAIHSEIGKTHTVEIHPDMDHLYNVKNFAANDKRGKVKVGDIKRNKALSHMANKVPRDADGWVTPDAIDKHIEKLPKKKVNLTVLPFNMRAQQHRQLQDDKHQYVVSGSLHPETLMSMGSGQHKAWKIIKEHQHKFHPGVEHLDQEDPEYNSNGEPAGEPVEHQFGWGRIDPYKGNIKETPGEGSGRLWGNEPNHGHWHVDELQSDFQNEDKIGRHVDEANRAREDAHHRDIKDEALKDPNHELHSHAKAIEDLESHDKKLGNEGPGADRIWDIRAPRHQQALEELRDSRDKLNSASKHFRDKARPHVEKRMNETPEVSSKVMHEILSHGHDDPQHAMHSAINALGRKMGVKSMSMDTPENQAKQSGLQTTEDGDVDYDRWAHDRDQGIDEYTPEAHEDYIKNNSGNKYLVSALKKLGHEKMKSILRSIGSNSDDFDWWNDDEDETSSDGIYRKLSDPEQHAVQDVARNHIPYEDDYRTKAGKDVELPVHQQLTYNKRPKSLGAEVKSKKEILGDDPSDKEEHVQYMKLHKKLKRIYDLLKNIK